MKSGSRGCDRNPQSEDGIFVLAHGDHLVLGEIFSSMRTCLVLVAAALLPVCDSYAATLRPRCAYAAAQSRAPGTLLRAGEDLRSAERTNAAADALFQQIDEDDDGFICFSAMVLMSL